MPNSDAQNQNDFDQQNTVVIGGAGHITRIAAESVGTPSLQGRSVGPGDIIGGSYKICELLGQGGMGYVFRATHLILQNEYGLKMLLPQHHNEDSRRRFEDEGRIIARLNHPNIVRVYNMGIDAGAFPFYAMDLLVGMSLYDCIKRGLPMSFSDVLDIFDQAAQGFSYAHANGVIHRDVKPSNLFLCHRPDNTLLVKIVDFGIAKKLDTAGAAGQSQTSTGEIFGSPYYMSPEQCLGQKIDARSDIYSLGCALYETICGVPPFRGASALETVMMHNAAAVPSIFDGQFAPLPGAGPEVDILLARMLAKEPAERYASMQEVVHDIARLKEGKAIGKAEVTKFVAPSRALTINNRLSPGRIATIGGIALASILGAVGVGLVFQHTQTAAPPPMLKKKVAFSSEKDKEAMDDSASMLDMTEARAGSRAGEAQALEAAYKNWPLVKSHPVVVDGRKMREFNFPPVSIGNLKTANQGGGQNAAGRVLINDNEEVVLYLDYKYAATQAVPSVLHKLSPDEIDTIVIVEPGSQGAFDGRGLGTDVAKKLELLHILQGWHRLRHVSLHYGSIDQGQIDALAGIKTLDILHLKDVSYPEGLNLKTLMSHLVNFTIDLMVADPFYDALYGSRKLQILMVKNSEDLIGRDRQIFSDRQLKRFGECPNLHMVAFSYIPVSSAMVDILLKLPSLRQIGMENVKVDAGQVARLMTRPNIVNIVLTGPYYDNRERSELASHGRSVHFTQ